MHSCRFCSWITKSRIVAGLLCVGAVSVVALAAEDHAEPPEAPPVSKFADVEPLMFYVNYLMDNIKTRMAGARYTEATQTGVARSANTLIVVFTALGLHEEDSPVKASAPRLAELAEELVASVADEAKAKSTYAALVKALDEGAEGGKPLAWEKRFSLGLLMKQVTFTNTRLKVYTITEARYAQAKKDELAGHAALLAVIGQAAHADTHEVKDPAQIGEWYEYCSEMRDAAGAVGDAIAIDNFPTFQATMERLKTNCDNCHRVFRPDQL